MDEGKSRGGTWEFVLRQRPRLLDRARKLCRNEADAEDLVQETFIRFGQAANEAKDLPAEKALAAWLVKTLTHAFFDQCRRKQVQTRGAKDPVLRNELASVREPLAQPTFEDITDEQFDQAVQQLSPVLRETFEMHAAGNKYQDIARTLGVKQGTIAKRLHDGRAKLRELLQRFLTPEAH